MKEFKKASSMDDGHDKFSAEDKNEVKK